MSFPLFRKCCFLHVHWDIMQTHAIAWCSYNTVIIKQFYLPQILGILENMSYFNCPKCNESSYIFGQGGARKTAEEMSLKFLGEVCHQFSFEYEHSGAITVRCYSSSLCPTHPPKPFPYLYLIGCIEMHAVRTSRKFTSKGSLRMVPSYFSCCFFVSLVWPLLSAYTIFVHFV